MNEKIDIRTADSREVAKLLSSGGMEIEQLAVALSSAFDRIATMEDNWEEFSRWSRSLRDILAEGYRRMDGD